MLTQYVIALSITAAAHLVLALYVYLNGRQRLTNLTYALYSVAIAWWSAFETLAITRVDAHAALFWWRFNHIGVIFIPIFFAHFVISLLDMSLQHRRRLVVGAFYAFGLAFLLLDTTSLFIGGVQAKFSFRQFINPGPIYPIFFALWLAWASYGLTELLMLYTRSTGARRNQLTYFCWSMLVAYVAGAPNFLPTFNIEIPYLMPFGTYAIPIYAFATAYAIVRHQLMDITVVIKRTLVFAGLVGSVVAVVSMVAFVSQDVLVRFVQIPKWCSNVLAAAIIAGLYGPLRHWLTNVTDRYLFQKQYDYRELLKKFMDEVLVGIKDLGQLSQLTVNRLTETVKLDGCHLLLQHPDTRAYEVVASQGTNGRRLTLKDDEQFIAFLRETGEPIWLDSKVHYPESVRSRCHELSARLCLPLHIHQELIGVLCLGKKKSDEAFTQDDVDVLRTVAGTLAIAVANAQQALELARTQAEAAQKEKLAVIGTLSAGINHEICNPLGIVKAQCEAFLLDVEDGILIGKSAQELLERTTNIMRGSLKQIDRATAITQKLSSFAKPIKEPSAQPVPVAQEVDEVLLLVGHDLKLEKIEVVKEIQPDVPPIVVDRRQLQEVLFNLIRNAGQAIKPPGTIWVRGYMKDADHVRVEIADSGSGIAPDTLSKIYDPFFTTKEPGKGTGLGLFIVRQMVERNKGRIAVESTVDKGTTFFLDFPTATVATAPAVGRA